MLGLLRMAHARLSAVCFRLGLVLPCTTLSLDMPVSGRGGWVVPPSYRQAGASVGSR